jgi:cytochrome c-type biogenesis protein CcmH/NrfF
MYRFKKQRKSAHPGSRVVLVVLLAAAVFAQQPAKKPNVDVRRVGARIACQCGCKDSVASCSMLECHFSKPAKARIAEMQTAGTPDTEIVQTFLKEYGQKVYLAPPNAFGWIVPYATVGIGLVIIWAFIRRYRKPQVMTDAGPIEIDDPALAKYKDQIERDLAKLE